MWKWINLKSHVILRYLLHDGVKIATVTRTKNAELGWASSFKINAWHLVGATRFHSYVSLKGQPEEIRDFLFFPAAAEALNSVILFIVSQHFYLYCQNQKPVAWNGKSNEKEEISRSKRFWVLSFVRPDGLFSIPLKILLFFLNLLFHPPSAPCLRFAPLSLVLLFLAFLLSFSFHVISFVFYHLCLNLSQPLMVSFCPNQSVLLFLLP